MIIYEKDNKLNINFENSVEEPPDLQIGKSGDKTQISVNGQSSGGGSFVIRVNEVKMDLGTKYELDKTWQEISDAIESGMYCCIIEYIRANEDDDDSEMVPAQRVVTGLYTENGLIFGLLGGSGNKMMYTADGKDGYPYMSSIEAIPGPGPIDPRPIT